MVVAIALFVVILVLTWLLFTLPMPGTQLVATSTPEKPVTHEPVPSNPTPTAPQPLSARVKLTSPQKNTSVGATFLAKGEAPGNWFFEATFPVQVRDKDGNVIGRTHANAQGDWMTTEQVAFTATVNIEGGYTGPATLVLMRDNPSGLPENDDAVEIPITIQ